MRRKGEVQGEGHMHKGTGMNRESQRRRLGRETGKKTMSHIAMLWSKGITSQQQLKTKQYLHSQQRGVKL